MIIENEICISNKFRIRNQLRITWIQLNNWPAKRENLPWAPWVPHSYHIPILLQRNLHKDWLGALSLERPALKMAQGLIWIKRAMKDTIHHTSKVMQERLEISHQLIYKNQRRRKRRKFSIKRVKILMKVPDLGEFLKELNSGLRGILSATLKSSAKQLWTSRINHFTLKKEQLKKMEQQKHHNPHINLRDQE